MVEGHQCHRVAAAHRKLLVGRAFKATSPNGRFADGAAAIHGVVLKKIEVHGKNLFYHFGTGRGGNGGNDGIVVVHVHFGMSGAFATYAPPAKPAKTTTRLRLEAPAGEGHLAVVADLSAMTVSYGDIGLYVSKAGSLGPDPLRPADDRERLWRAMQATASPIGLVLMDQSAIAGVGNIYRAEILFIAGCNPHVPARSVPRAMFERLWSVSVSLLRRGFLTGSILTVPPAEAARLGDASLRRFIYGVSKCPRCAHAVSATPMGGRTLHMCTGPCQSPGRTPAPLVGYDNMGDDGADLAEFGLTMASPAHAAAEKAAAGEGRNVEHVALLVDDDGDGGIPQVTPSKGQPRKRRGGGASEAVETPPLVKRTRPPLGSPEAAETERNARDRLARAVTGVIAAADTGRRTRSGPTGRRGE